jgi:hypothetical protein
MSNILHITCDGCGAAVGFTELDRIVECRFCKTKLFVQAENYIPEYYIEPKIDKVAARRALQKFLTGPGMAGGLLKNSHFHSATLCFVPYNDVKLRRLGTLETDHFKRNTEVPGYRNSNIEEKRETSVVINDLHRLEPAVKLTGFALEHTHVFSVLKDSGAPVLPFNREKQAAEGQIYLPQISADKILNDLKKRNMAHSVLDETDFVEIRVRRVFYPLFRLKYRFSGRLYTAVVDGINGKIIYGVAPQNDTFRVIYMVAMTAFSGFFFGKLFASQMVENGARGIGETSGSAFEVGITLFVLLSVFIAAIAGLTYGAWRQFRYSGEIIKEGDVYRIEKYNSSFKGSFILNYLKKLDSDAASRWV